MAAGAEAVVTTGRRSSPESEARARRIAAAWDLPYLSRQGQSIARVREAARSLGVESPAVIVVEEAEIALYIPQGPVDPAGGGTQPVTELIFRYHPGMGLNRLRRWIGGERDWMIEAMGLQKGDRLLDATLGLGSDALVASYVVGDEGQVVGVESQRLLALIVSEGMRTYQHPQPGVTESLRRIAVVHADHRRYLKEAPSGSFDVVYFDPMFAQPVQKSAQMRPIRALANADALDEATLREALRVARRRVVVKDRPMGPYAHNPFFDEVIGGGGSRIVYCIAAVP